ncbi:MAG: hypothetical protein LBQ15_05515 [Clostridium sp.]|jgi:hypothetical protein|nr:hypothetical protein [Clostridium sp.]
MKNKKAYAFLLFCPILLLCGCTADRPAEETSASSAVSSAAQDPAPAPSPQAGTGGQADPPEQLIITVEPGTVTPDKLNDVTVTVTNPFDTTATTGEAYGLQRAEDSRWADIPFDQSYHDLAILLPPGGSHVFHEDWTKWMADQDSGTYRIRKHVSMDGSAYEIFGTFEFVQDAASSHNGEETREGDTATDGLPSVDTDSAQQISSQKTETDVSALSAQITMDAVLDPSGKLTVVVTNHSDAEVLSGERFGLQKSTEENVWTDVPLSVVFRDLGIPVPPGKSQTSQYDIPALTALESGASYRIVKSVYYNQAELLLTAAF